MGKAPSTPALISPPRWASRWLPPPTEPSSTPTSSADTAEPSFSSTATVLLPASATCRHSRLPPASRCIAEKSSATSASAAAAPGLTSTTKSESMTLPSIPTSTSASRSPTRVDSPRAARTAAAGRLSSVCPRPRSALFVPIGLRSRSRRISRFWLTENPVGLIRERLTSASLLPQSHPTIRHNQGIARILRVVLHRRGWSQPAGVQIHPLPQVGDVLRSLIGDAGDVILIDQHGGGALVLPRQFLDVDHRAVGDAAHRVEPLPPFALEFFRALRLAPQKKIGAERDARAAQNQTVKSKWIHDQPEGTSRARRQLPDSTRISRKAESRKRRTGYQRPRLR